MVAPTSLVTALMFFFGWSHAYWFCHYFGVESTMLGFTTADYLMRSVDGLFVPLLVGAVLVLAVLTAQRRFVNALGDGRTRVAARVAGVLGAVLVVFGLVNAVGVHVLDRPPFPALALAAGAPLSVYGARLLRRTRPADRGHPAAAPGPGQLVAEWGLAFLLVALGLFWAAVDYSASVGTARARATVSGLRAQPSVVLYSAKGLALRGTGLREVVCPEAESAYRFRYDGLALVLQSGNQYLLLPRAWTSRDGTAIVLPRGDSTRLEFTPAAAPDRPAPPGCG